jgi:hypothetical protein
MRPSMLGGVLELIEPNLEAQVRKRVRERLHAI